MVRDIFIDADSILYRASHLACADKDLKEAEELAGEEEEDIGLDTVSCSATSDAQRIFHSMVEEIMTEVKANAHTKCYEINEAPKLVITVKRKLEVCADLAENFRYDVMGAVSDPNVKGYKANRTGMEVPEGLDELYEYVYNLEESICISGVEADDVCVYQGRQGHIVCALDKDVLGSLEYAYNYGKKEWVDNDPLKIHQFPFLQTIMGDTGDGLRGVFRVGAKGAEKAIGQLEDEYELWRAVVVQYVKKDQTIEEAIATMRSVRMDQWTPENGLVLWEPPFKDHVQTRAEVYEYMEVMRKERDYD